MQAKSSSKGFRPPSAEAFPAYPASWYLFCASGQLKDKPFSQRILGRQLVAYRKASGQVSVMDANCAHLGADLGCGTVVGDTLQCPFHNWRYGADGVCTSIPHAAQIPAFARLRTYPVVEQHGSVFFFNGPEPLFALPFFFGADPGDFAAGRAFRYVADCPWYMTAANAFDMQHFRCVHGRELIDRCQVDCPAPFARRNRYRAAIVGGSRSDGFLRTFAGPTVDVSITCWGGTYMLVTALNLMVRRWLTYEFVADESRNLLGIQYNPATLIEGDGTMADFFGWLAHLPAHRQNVLQQEVSVPARIAQAANFG